MIGEFSFDIDSIVSIYCTALIHTCNDEIIRFWDKPRTKKDLRRVTTEGKCNLPKPISMQTRQFPIFAARGKITSLIVRVLLF